MKTLKDKINDVDERELREEIEEHLGGVGIEGAPDDFEPEVSADAYDQELQG